MAGDSATANAAACAKRLDVPMTKLSNVYFGFSRAGVEVGAATGVSLTTVETGRSTDSTSSISRIAGLTTRAKLVTGLLGVDRDASAERISSLARWSIMSRAKSESTSRYRVSCMIPCGTAASTTARMRGDTSRPRDTSSTTSRQRVSRMSGEFVMVRSCLWISHHISHKCRVVIRGSQLVENRPCGFD